VSRTRRWKPPQDASALVARVRREIRERIASTPGRRLDPTMDVVDGVHAFHVRQFGSQLTVEVWVGPLRRRQRFRTRKQEIDYDRVVASILAYVDAQQEALLTQDRVQQDRERRAEYLRSLGWPVAQQSFVADRGDVVAEVTELGTAFSLFIPAGPGHDELVNKLTGLLAPFYEESPS
jgi:hypothetical protein